MADRIIVINQTLNEERNIERFCTYYSSVADEILIIDGGSTDKTIEIAKQVDIVKVKDASHLQEINSWGPVTPGMVQTQIGIDWAKERGADWIIKDDGDCWPNSYLRKYGRGILEACKKPSVFLYRLYIWGKDQYFPKYNYPGQSLWAWKPREIDIHCDKDDEFSNVFLNMPAESQQKKLNYPFVCLHYFCPDEKTTQAKIKRKASIGVPMIHPLNSIYAPPEPLPGWIL